LFVLAATLPLALRRVVPLISLIAVMGGAFAIQVFGYDAGLLAFSMVLALFSVGAYSSSTRESLAGLAAVVVIVVLTWLDPQNQGSLWVLFLFGLLFGIWLVGDTLRRRTAQMAELEARTAGLEQEREEGSRRAVAQERARIARELHDIIAHSVSVMVVQAAAAGRVLDSQPETARASLEAIETTGRQALSEMRRLIGVMRREELLEDAKAPQPGLARVEALVDDMRGAGLPVDLRVEGDPGPLPPGVDVSAYRVLQEALTNALRHAGPARVSVIVRYRPEDVELEVSDDGHGPMEDPASTGGHGLVGMRERVALFQGDFEAGPRAGGGFAVRARLPIGSSGG
jgi:signal transduction histidine kinase